MGGIKNSPNTPREPPIVPTASIVLDHPNQISDVTEWDVDFHQLTPGLNETKLKFQASGDCMVYGISMSKRVHQTGNPPKGWLTFGIADAATLNTWQSTPAQQNDLLHFSSADGFESLSRAGFNAAVFSFTENSFRSLAQSIGMDLPDSFDTSFKFQIANKMNRLTDLYVKLNSLLSSPSVCWTKDLEQEIALNVLDLIKDDVVHSDKSSLSSRQKAMYRAIDYMKENYETALPIADLCKEVGASWRTLDRAFKENFGIGPKAYFNQMRLNWVRYTLLKENECDTIFEAANHYDFWHMGQFAKDYKRLFGELPSETMKH
ncbi:transcriptional regulator EutR [Roseovarius albus]|uniref:Transcriptional regulator EutR n=1 Tax=Roseovarius albus TaxID=1247867 RepID=A0A1X7A150_9RHOB|nr:helix-turn-helix domain-containing protein [Roseovarius albus]SLN67268.1 transcriptional regulator EutR [Roseovarius albus]